MPQNSGMMKRREIDVLVGRANVRVSLSLPLPLLDAIDAEAERIGIGRSALMAYWLSQQLGEHAVTGGRHGGLRPAALFKAEK